MDQSKKVITVQTVINAQVEKVWEAWTSPSHITQWNYASDDWHSPSAENDLQVGGKFKSRMAARVLILKVFMMMSGNMNA